MLQKNKPIILLFLAVAIVCVTALIIWQDLKTDIKAAQVEKPKYEQTQNAALKQIGHEVQMEKANCFIDWERREIWARLSLDNHSVVECTVDAAKRLKIETVKYLSERLAPL